MPHTTNGQRLLALIGTLLLMALAILLLTRGPSTAASSGWIEGWQEVKPFTLPRRALAAMATSTHLYVIGGMDGEERYVAQTEYAPILPDGTLGDWRITSSLNEPRFYLAAAAVNGYLYAIGGANGARGADNVPSATVERARILPDGSLGLWEITNYLTTPRRGLKAAVIGTHLYAIGGYNGAFLKSVERADVAAEGALSAWRLDPRQAVIDRYIHAAASLNGALYLLGGHVQSAEKMSYGDVEMARVNADGALQDWQVQPSTLLNPRFIASASAMNGHLYILGGHDGAQRLRSVETAPLSATGGVGRWTHAAPMNHARSAADVAVHANHIYVLGGMDEQGILSSVEMTEQREDGGLGHRATRR